MNIIIRPETDRDIENIYALTLLAFAPMPFASGTEQDMINALRERQALTLSLVAEVEGKLAGHVAFSPAPCDDPSQLWFALGPIAVAPDLQRKGIGTALIRHGLQHVSNLGATGCIVEGDTAYYPRFGFVPNPKLAPEGVSQDHFMRLQWVDKPPAMAHFNSIFYE